MVRIALANIRFPRTREESITLAERAVADAAAGDAEVVCFPECFVPGYRAPAKSVPPPDAAFLECAWSAVAEAAARANVAVVLGTERIVDEVYGDAQNSFHEKAVLCRAAENTLLRHCELRERRIANDVSGGASGRDTAQLSTLRQGRSTLRRSRSLNGYGPACFTLQTRRIGSSLTG